MRVNRFARADEEIPPAGVIFVIVLVFSIKLVPLNQLIITLVFLAVVSKD